jgi:CPA2 family monovalent cation:H+ antiporter-2
MHDLQILRDLVVLVAVAIPVVAIAERLRAPTVVGFLVTGVVIGPHGLGLIQAPDSVAALAELGLVLLLFTIGLELSLSRIFKLGRTVFQGGGLQVLGTLSVVAGLALIGGAAWPNAVLWGSLAALSSTAIVLKVLKEREELNTTHGRVMLAILLFQDLCVVPLMLLVPLLAGGGGSPVAALGRTLLSIGVVATLVLGGRYFVPWILDRVVGLRNRELFTLCILLFGLGAAYVTAQFGLSLALGAFVAGLVVSESEYGLQAMSDALPFRDTFSGIFFVSVGMLLDTRFVIEHPVLVLGSTVVLMALKASIAASVTRGLVRSWAVSVRCGLGLAQIGEFSFVLALVARPFGLLDGDSYRVFIAASVLSMLSSPFIIAASRPVARWIGRMAGEEGLQLKPEAAEQLSALDDHVVIVGYGLNGRNLARVLRAANIPYVILEQNGQVVRRCLGSGEPIHFGDGTSREVLHKVGLERARVLVLAISSPADERRCVAVARDLSPNTRIVVRTRYVAEIDELRRLGADDVVPEEFETSLEIFARVLRLYGVASNVVAREVKTARGEHYEMLRGLAMPDLQLDLRQLGVHAALDTVEIERDSPAVGGNPVSLRLRERTGATVIAVVRDGTPLYNPDPHFSFAIGDTVVLVGQRPALERAVRLFRAAEA